MAVINRLPELRKARGVGYKKIARGTGLPVNTVFRVASGQSQRLDFETLNRLCEYFRVPVSSILEWVPDDQAPAPRASAPGGASEWVSPLKRRRRADPPATLE